ncbi:MAG: polysaccharide deacetylase, partial [Sphingomonas sp.]|nr:polysaccharide deacetylase [Sphingomonas sp.]
MTKPIFFDPTGRRARRTFAIALAAVAAMVAAMVALALALTTSRGHAPIRFAEDADRPVAIAAAVPAVAPGAWLPVATTPTDRAPRQVFAFYMPWDEPSRRALADRLSEIDWVVPGLATIAGPDRVMTYDADPTLHAILAKAPTRPRVMPMVQNAAPDGHWDGTGTAKLLADPAARRRFADALTRMVTRERGAGVMLDLENLPRSAHANYRRFLAALRTRFAGRGWTVALAVPVADPDWDLAAYAAVADRLFVMAYDEHWMGGEAGPIASQPWFMRVVADAVRAIGRDKAVVALGNYAYDWSGGRTEPLTIADAWSRAARAQTMPVFDAGSGTMHFAYREHGRAHQVWMLDAVSAMNQLRVLDQLGVRSTALWRLGSEDPGFWSALRGDAAGVQRLPPMPGVLVAGAGEIMRLDAEARAGARTFGAGRDGMIRAARYDRLPTPDRVQRTGAHRRLVALTFDDGPDPVWTPRILDVLRREGVPATFFVTGASALGQGALLRRIVAEGSELGNHSTSHADLSQRSPAAIRLELTAAERLVEAYTGRTLRLFRPPFLGDADPDKRDELHATRVAAGMGYLTVGLNVDPLDWRAPGRDAIVARTIAGVEAGTAAQPHQIVLLHDSGGDRSQTLAALP